MTRMLAGGNRQIPKGEGAAPVRAYLAAVPADKRAIGKQLDALIAASVPGVRKAVKWNSPFYGIEGKGWFLSFHVFSRYVKVTFFKGASLKPQPPVASKVDDVHYLHVSAESPLDEARFVDWVKQAARLPGYLS